MTKEEHDFFVDPQLPPEKKEQFEENFFSRNMESERERIRYIFIL